MADTSSQSSLPKLLKVREVAELFDVTPATVREWLKTGELHGVKIGQGHYWRVPVDSVIALAQQRHGDIQ